VKRGFDIAVSGALLVLTLPLWALIALAIRLQDGGPVLFRQTRVGRGQREFGLIKFRSMVTDAEARGGYQTVAADPRITPVGKWLRRSSLDELPQLWNVLRGEMSLVGPRPDTPAQAAGYDPDDWALRCSVRPGLTGLAQVTRKSAGGGKTRLQLDLEYVRNRSIRLDLAILGRTVLFALLLANR
jgi:lipopolysaccharide/colanic/teichoic acid biosynthesis glycosyltransferase